MTDGAGASMKLFIASLSKEDLTDFYSELPAWDELRRADNHVFAAFGREDIVALDFSEDNSSEKLFADVGLEPGKMGAHTDGWSRIYSCGLEEKSGEIELGDLKFATLVMVRVPTDKADRRTDTNIEIIHEVIKNHQYLRCWSTDGYYQLCLLYRGMFGEESTSLLIDDIRKAGAQTYSCPLVSIPWVKSATMIDPEDDMLAEISLTAKLDSLAEDDGPGALCWALRNSAEDPERFTCLLDYFRFSHGNHDLLFNSEGICRHECDGKEADELETFRIRIYLARLFQELWLLRRSNDAIQSTRTRVHCLISDHIITKIEESVDGEGCGDKRECVVEQPDPLINPPKDEETGTTQRQHPVQPVHPFGVRYLANGKDWSERMEKVKWDYAKKIEMAYKQTCRLFLGEREPIKLRFSYRLDWGDLPSNVFRPAIHCRIYDRLLEGKEPLTYTVALSYKHMDSEHWPILIMHELIVGATHALFQRLDGLLEVKDENGNAPFYHKKISAVRNAIWKMLSEPLASAFGLMKRPFENIGDYTSHVLAKQLFPSQRKKDRYVLTPGYVFRLCLAEFFRLRMHKHGDGDKLDLHWYEDLEQAWINLKSSPTLDIQYATPSSALLFNPDIEDLFLHSYGMAARKNLVNAQCLAWTLASEFLRQLCESFDMKPEQQSEGLESLMGSQLLYRCLVSQDEDLIKLVEKIAEARKAGRDITSDIEHIKQHVEAINEVEQKADINLSDIKPPGRIFTELSSDELKRRPWSTFAKLAWMDQKTKQHLRVLKSNQLELHGYTSEIRLEPFHKFDSGYDLKLHGGEFLSSCILKEGGAVTDFVRPEVLHFPVKPGRDGRAPSKLFYGTVFKSYIGKSVSEDIGRYEYLDIIRYMQFELCCIKNATDKLEQKGAWTHLAGKPVSFNIVSWPLLEEHNPWAEEFFEDYLQAISGLCKAIKSHEAYPVIEIPEGPLPEAFIIEDDLSKRETGIGIWKLLKKLIMDGDAMGVAVDDQWAEGTDVLRLDDITSFVMKYITKESMRFFLVKVDHQVLFRLLRIRRDFFNAPSNNVHWQSALSVLIKVAKIIAKNQGETNQNIEVMNKKIHIVFEGYKGPLYRNREDAESYQQKLKEVFEISIKDDKIFNFDFDRIFLQGDVE